MAHKFAQYNCLLMGEYKNAYSSEDIVSHTYMLIYICNIVEITIRSKSYIDVLPT